MHGLDTEFKELNEAEMKHLAIAIRYVIREAELNKHKRPKMTTLMEEMSELYLAMRGKHKDDPETELIHVASCAINILWQIYNGDLEKVNNVVRHDWSK
jgi:hypothetical protein